jgi:hypothetical protein
MSPKKSSSKNIQKSSINIPFRIPFRIPDGQPVFLSPFVRKKSFCPAASCALSPEVGVQEFICFIQD